MYANAAVLQSLGQRAFDFYGLVKACLSHSRLQKNEINFQEDETAEKIQIKECYVTGSGGHR